MDSTLFAISMVVLLLSVLREGVQASGEGMQATNVTGKPNFLFILMDDWGTAYFANCI